jgi:hypothetical protein
MTKYSEAQAKDEIRGALVDIGRGRTQLEATLRRLGTLPGYKRVAAESRKVGGDTWADSLAWHLAGSIAEWVKDLKRESELVRKDLRETEATVAASARRLRAEARTRFHDPDFSPKPAASDGAKRAYHDAVRKAVAIEFYAEGTGVSGSSWETCLACKTNFHGLWLCVGEKPSKRWWECPKGCNATEANRRRVAVLRGADKWKGYERLAKEKAVAAALCKQDEARRRALAGLRDQLPAVRWHEIQDAVEQAAAVNCGTMSDSIDCKQCKAEWWPFDAVFVDADNIRGEKPWWLCPKGCNAKSRHAVAAIARNARERALLAPVAKSSGVAA